MCFIYNIQLSEADSKGLEDKRGSFKENGVLCNKGIRGALD